MITTIKIKFSCGHTHDVEIAGVINWDKNNTYNVAVNLGMCNFQNVTSVGVCHNCKK